VRRRRQLFAGLSPWGPGFDPKSVHVRFLVERVALIYAFLCLLRFSLVSMIPPMLHTRLNLHIALERRRMGEVWEPSKSKALSEIGEHWIEKYFHFFVYVLHRVKRRFMYKFTYCLFESVACLLSYRERHFNQTTRCRLVQESKLHKHRRVGLKSSTD
jgi:hypothetical protein